MGIWFREYNYRHLIRYPERECHSQLGRALALFSHLNPLAFIFYVLRWERELICHWDGWLVSNLIPAGAANPSSCGRESKPRPSMRIHAFHYTDHKDPDVDVLDGPEPTELHPTFTIPQVGMQISVLLINGHLCKNITSAVTTCTIV